MHNQWTVYIIVETMHGRTCSMHLHATEDALSNTSQSSDIVFWFPPILHSVPCLYKTQVTQLFNICGAIQDQVGGISIYNSPFC